MAANLPHDPASSFHHVGPRSGVLTDLPTSRRPCGFSLLSGCVAMKLAWRAYVPSVGTEFVAHVSPVPASRFDALPGTCQDMAATRRSCCSRRRTPSATHRARVRPVEPIPHARRRSDHSSAFATRPPDRVFPGHSPVAPFSRGVPLPVRPQRGLVGRRRSSLVRRPTALMGFVPFAGLIPQTGGLIRSVARRKRRG